MTSSLRIGRAALGLMVYQLFVVLLVSGGRAARLVNWDATWYRDIAALGYSVKLPLVHEAAGGSNVAFFPAFPVLVRGVLHTVPVDANVATLIASWIACIVMWAYFLLVLRRLGVRAGTSWLAVFAFIVLPGSFYAVVGYSESLFTAAALGYVYWTLRGMASDAPTTPSRRAIFIALAVMHASIFTLTRIVGVPLVAFPILLVAVGATPHLQLRKLALPIAMGVASLAGFLGYLYYCSVHWGRWDMYFEANRVGWGTHFDPSNLYSWAFYRDKFFTGNLSEVVSRLLTIATLVGAISLVRWTWGRRHTTPAPLALSILGLGFIAELMGTQSGLHSMLRYLFPAFALLIPVAAVWAQQAHEKSKSPSPASSATLPSTWPSLGWQVAGALIALGFFAFQIMLVIRYSRNEWVS